MNNRWIAGTLLIGVSALFFSCTSFSNQQGKLEDQVDSLSFVNEQQQAVLDDMASYIAQISAVMDSINVQEGILTLRVDENGQPLAKRKILENLSKLEEVLQNKRAEITRLDSLLNQRNDQVRQLSKMVRHLYAEIDAKDQTIQQLRDEVSAKNERIRTLTGTVDNLTENINNMSDTLRGVKNEVRDLQEQNRTIVAQSREVYYIIGTNKELVNLGILTKGGLFKKSTVDAGELDVSKFKKADMDHLRSIKISGDNPKIMSITPPSSSYKMEVIENEDDIFASEYVLQITDPARFWNASKFLVIVVRK